MLTWRYLGWGWVYDGAGDALVKAEQTYPDWVKYTRTNRRGPGQGWVKYALWWGQTEDALDSVEAKIPWMRPSQRRYDWGQTKDALIEVEPMMPWSWLS